ncbi:uncharacterized protein VTP21DRAFT_8570 [Calcarisporiella thermophila]|uniref:uncharacterized protein n=1 Tax=Calcarisporiella thermophila TaxID=911321 RepID=UPI003742C535
MLTEGHPSSNSSQGVELRFCATFAVIILPLPNLTPGILVCLEETVTLDSTRISNTPIILYTILSPPSLLYSRQYPFLPPQYHPLVKDIYWPGPQSFMDANFNSPLMVVVLLLS